MTPTPNTSFTSVTPKQIRVIGVPLDLGQSRRGVEIFHSLKSVLKSSGHLRELALQLGDPLLGPLGALLRGMGARGLALFGAREQIGAGGVARQPERDGLVTEGGEHPVEPERSARRRVSEHLARDQIALDAVERTQPLPRGCVDVEAHDLFDAEGVKAR